MNAFGLRTMFIILVLGLSLVLSAFPDAQAAKDFVAEGFEGGAVSAQGNTAGRTGLGWTQSSPDNGPVLPVSLSGAETGIVSFDLQRKSDAAEQRPGTVVEFLDANEKNVFVLYVRWSFPKRGTVFSINSAPGNDYFQNGVALWSPFIPLNREVQPGEWVHIDLTWDDARSEYKAFADRTPLNARSGSIQLGTSGPDVPDLRPALNEEKKALGEPPPYPPKKFAYFLERTTAISLGNHLLKDFPAFRKRTLLSHAVLDNFELRTGSVASISSVTHNAFSAAGYSGSLVAGDTLTVRLGAQDGGNASFDIDGVASRNPMVESSQEPGTYVGSYVVKPGDFSSTGRITGHFNSYTGFEAAPVEAPNPAGIDGRTRLRVVSATSLLPADKTSRTKVTVRADDANGMPLKNRSLKLSLSTTDEYTGTVGGGSLEDTVGGILDVDWGGVTDSFGEVTAQVRSGFAAKTMLVSARDMVSGDVGIGWVRSYIEGTVDILVKNPEASALSFPGTLEAGVSRPWLTADGKSRSRITATVRDPAGAPLPGHILSFSLAGDNGTVKVIQSRTDRNGAAYADYVAGLRMGQAIIEIRDQTSGLWTMVQIDLRPDAPAEISLTADPAEVVIGGSGATVTATVMDANKNPSRDVVVTFAMAAGNGSLSAVSAGTDPRTGKASVTFTPGRTAGTAMVRGTVTSREPGAEEIAAAQGAVFLFGLATDPGTLTVERWIAKAGDRVVDGDGLVVLKDRSGASYTVTAPHDGMVSVFAAEAGDEVRYGQTLGYVLPQSFSRLQRELGRYPSR